MKTYDVTIGVTVEAYGTVKIGARSARDAEARVDKLIENGALFDLTVFKPDWRSSNELRVIEDSARELTR